MKTGNKKLISTLTALFMISASSSYADNNDARINIDGLDFPAAPVCYDHTGAQAQIINSDNHSAVVMYANIRYLDAQNIADPAILINERFWNNLSDVQKAFTLAHECYHLSSGDAHAIYSDLQSSGIKQSRDDMLQFEDDADCSAAQMLTQNYGYSADIMNEIHPLVDRVSNRKETLRRMENIHQCAEFFAQEQIASALDY